MDTILIAGATGTNGRMVLEELLKAGRSVRALVRSKAKAASLAKPGVELVVGDLADHASLVAALKGVRRAFVLAPVAEDATQWFSNFFTASKANGVWHNVKLSGMGAGDPQSLLLSQHRDSDEMLKASGIAYTILQPNSFHQNMLWSAATIKATGQFYVPMGDARQSLVDVRDIAAVAAKTLSEAGHEGKTYELTGPEALSFTDVAAQLSVATGKKVHYVAVPQSAAEQGMLQAGMPAWEAKHVAEIYSAFGTGAYARVTDIILLSPSFSGARPSRSVNSRGTSHRIFHKRDGRRSKLLQPPPVIV